MQVEKTVLTLHLEYTAWATGLLLEAAPRLTGDELNRNLQGSHGSVLDTLRHIFYGDRVWLARLEGRPQKFADEGPGPSLDALKQEWPPLLVRFRDFVGALPDTEIASDLHYTNLKGEAWSVARWKVVLHVVNHGTLHRGQVMGMFRQLGHPPPATDLIYFYLKP
jgi:uncharacterized damage-inducible protein DinB